MSSRARTPVRLTLGLCIAGGLATGIALARPAADDGADAASPAAAEEVVTNDAGLAYEYPSVSGDDESPLVDDPAEAAAPSEPAVITIADFAFGSPITVAPGAEIVVTNVDGAPHSVTADDSSFDSGILGQNESASVIAPSSPGTYTFFCVVHPSMQGEFIVG